VERCWTLPWIASVRSQSGAKVALGKQSSYWERWVMRVIQPLLSDV
jgi:hypothetical protein